MISSLRVASSWRVARFMRLAITRSLTELEEEVEKAGLPLPEGKYGKQELMQILAKHFWEMEHPGQPMPRFISPMLISPLKARPPKEQEEIWESPEWYAETKQNGLRIIGYYTVPNHFRTRGLSVKSYLPGDVTDKLWWLDVDVGDYEGTIVDGEVISTTKQVDTRPYVAGGEGRVTNNVLQAATSLMSIENSQAAQEGNGMPLRYILYDIVRFKNEDVQTMAYKQRRELLTEFFVLLEAKVAKGQVILNDSTNLNKRDLYKKIVDQGGEGIVLKYERGLYKEGPTRTREQFKVKTQVEVDAVVTGYSKPRKGSTYEKRGLIGGVIFSTKDITDDQWYEVGSVSNITMGQRKEWSEQNPDGTLKGLNPDILGTVWEVEGQEWNKNVKLSHLKIVRQRKGVDAKDPEEAVFDRQAIVRALGGG